MNWRLFWEFSGGNITENMVHQIAWIMSALELPLPMRGYVAFPTSKFVWYVLAALGANVTLNVKELPGASVLGSELSENGLFGLFVVTVRETSVWGLIAEPLLFVNVNGTCVVLVVSVFGKVREFALFG